MYFTIIIEIKIMNLHTGNMKKHMFDAIDKLTNMYTTCKEKLKLPAPLHEYINDE